MLNLTILAVAYKPKVELVNRLIENFSSNYLSLLAYVKLGLVVKELVLLTNSSLVTE